MSAFRCGSNRIPGQHPDLVRFHLNAVIKIQSISVTQGVAQCQKQTLTHTLSPIFIFSNLFIFQALTASKPTANPRP
jgi:hypothetical protein